MQRFRIADLVSTQSEPHALRRTATIAGFRELVDWLVRRTYPHRARIRRSF